MDNNTGWVLIIAIWAAYEAWKRWLEHRWPKP